MIPAGDAPEKKCVMLIEDDNDIREALAEVLDMEGYKVECAGNGQEGLARLRASATDPSLILLDLMMPVMDGIQFCNEQRCDVRLSRIPVVIMSADNYLSRKATGVEADGFLKKPVELDALLETIKRYCS